jgi:Fe-S-cluster containining protein
MNRHQRRAHASTGKKRRLDLISNADAAYHMLAEHAAGISDETPCKAGCSACCQQLVGVTRSEAEAIVARHPKEVAAALPALRDHATEIERLVQDGRDFGEGFESMLVRVREAWWRDRRTCPFLVEGICSIYKNRPFACRTHYVQSDPALCASREDGVVVKKVLSDVVDHLNRKIIEWDRHVDPNAWTAYLPIAICELADARK